MLSMGTPTNCKLEVASPSSLFTALTPQVGPWVQEIAFHFLDGSTKRPPFEYQQMQDGQQRKLPCIQPNRGSFFSVTAAG